MADRLVPAGPFPVPHATKDVVALITDLFVTPRNLVYKWSRITGQTAQVRLAYPGQHLASVITGVGGAGTAARGDDLQDGSEVKSCSRADQLGDCNECGSPVPSSFDACPASGCGSKDINRKTDSHWIFAIKTMDELDLLLNRVPRVVLVLFDRRQDDLTTIQIRAWEIWPRAKRHEHFVLFMRDYFENNFEKKRKAGLTAAPCNLHPLKFDFFLMNPVPVFRAYVHDPERVGRVDIDLHVDPSDDRALLSPEPMPVSVCKEEELEWVVTKASPASVLAGALPKAAGDVREILKNARARATTDAVRTAARQLKTMLATLNEEARAPLEMREKRIKETPSTYRRR